MRIPFLSRRPPEPVEERVIRDHHLWGAWARGDDAIPGASPAGIRVSRESALQLSSVWACVSLIADTIASLPADALVSVPGSARKALVPKPSWLTEPNPEQTWLQWVHQQLVSLLLDGTAFVATVRGPNGDVLEAWVIPPERVTMRREFRDGRRSIVYHVASEEGFRTLGPLEMFHVPAFTMPGKMRGIPPIVEAARHMVGSGLAAQEFSERFFGQGLSMSGVIEVEGELSPEEARRLRDDFSRSHAGLQRAHLPGVLTAGAKWNSTAVPPEQAQFLESRQFSVAEIARFFRCPPHLIGDVERSTSWGTGIEEQHINFVMHTLLPWLTRLEQAYTRHLLLFQGPAYVKFNVEGLLRGDVEARVAMYTFGRTWGVLSADEIRGLEDLPPLPDGRGETYLVPLNMTVAPKAGEEPPAPEPAEVIGEGEE